MLAVVVAAETAWQLLLCWPACCRQALLLLLLLQG